MCSLCRKEPCMNRCPNAKETKPILVCDVCDDGINEGDKYFEVVQKCKMNYICERCLEDMTADEILFFCGEKMQIARSD